MAPDLAHSTFLFFFPNESPVNIIKIHEQERLTEELAGNSRRLMLAYCSKVSCKNRGSLYNGVSTATPPEDSCQESTDFLPPFSLFPQHLYLLHIGLILFFSRPTFWPLIHVPFRCPLRYPKPLKSLWPSILDVLDELYQSPCLNSQFLRDGLRLAQVSTSEFHQLYIEAPGQRWVNQGSLGYDETSFYRRKIWARKRELSSLL